MSEMLQRAAIHLLAEDNPTPETARSRLRRILQLGPKTVRQELLTNWLPRRWSETAEQDEKMFDPENLSPDGQQSSDAAEADSLAEEKAGATWATLSPPERKTFLDAVAMMAPVSKAEQDLGRTLELNEPSPQDT